EPRYTMLESVWEYARARLEESGDAPMIRKRHLDYFVRFAEEAEKMIEGPRQAEWLQRLGAERINLRFALEWSAHAAGAAEAGLRLAGALTRYAEVRGQLHEAREYAAAVLAHPEAAARTAARAKALAGAGRLAWCQDANADAMTFYEEAMSIYKELGDRRSVGFLLAQMGFVAREEDDDASARSFFEESLAIGREFGDERLIAIALSGQGTALADRGDYAAARALKEPSLALYRKLGDKWIVGLA